MLHLTLRNLLARKVRFLMSGFAIVLGIAFLAGVLVFSNGLSSTFDAVTKGSTSDGKVRPADTEAFGVGAAGISSATLSPELVAKIGELPSVAAATGDVDGFGVNLLDSNGALVGGTGAPTLSFNYVDDTKNMAGEPILQLIEGTWPVGPGELVMDDGAAKRAKYDVGDTVGLLAPFGNPERSATLVGTAEFNGGGTAGATLLIFSTTMAQDLFLGGKDAFSGVSLTAADGFTRQEMVDQVSALLPAGFEAVTGDKLVDESQSTIGALVDVISTFLLVFALIAVVVGGFIIVNTFTILVAQRTRELALLRALGASQRQVTFSVLLEAAVMAIVASTVGIGVGYLLAQGLAGLFRSIGLDIASDSLVLTPNSVIFSYAVGVIVTLVAAWLPSRRAGKVSPIAAMRGDSSTPTVSLKRRTIIGTGAIALGAGLAIAGLTGAPGPAAVWIGIAALIWILTCAVLTSVFGRPVLLACRELFGRLFGTAGRLAGENALRDPRRTGATASALMIGLALVSLISVLASSLNATVDKSVDEQFSADFTVQGLQFAPFSTTWTEKIAAVDGVGLIARQQRLSAQVPAPKSGEDPKTVIITGDDPAANEIYTYPMVAGVQKTTGNEALVVDSLAKDEGWSVGDSVTLTFPGSKTLTVKLTGIYEPTGGTAQMSIPLELLTTVGIARQDSALSIMAAPGADIAKLKADLTAITEEAKILSVYDREGFADSLRDQVNQLLFMIYGLLALAIIIAIIGIVNTLGLSVIERTREIGLLRAIGMSRARVRRMVTLESVCIALLGAVMGMVIGVVTGVLLREALSNDLTALGLPLGSLLVFLAISVVVGVLAAVIPAIRAARLNVLSAIASQ